MISLSTVVGSVVPPVTTGGKPFKVFDGTGYLDKSALLKEITTPMYLHKYWIISPESTIVPSRNQLIENIKINETLCDGNLT